MISGGPLVMSTQTEPQSTDIASMPLEAPRSPKPPRPPQRTQTHGPVPLPQQMTHELASDDYLEVSK